MSPCYDRFHLYIANTVEKHILFVLLIVIMVNFFISASSWWANTDRQGKRIKGGLDKSLSLKPSLECSWKLCREVSTYSSSQGKEDHAAGQLGSNPHSLGCFPDLLAFLWDFPGFHEITHCYWFVVFHQMNQSTSWALCIPNTNAQRSTWVFCSLSTWGRFCAKRWDIQPHLWKVLDIILTTTYTETVF